MTNFKFPLEPPRDEWYLSQSIEEKHKMIDHYIRIVQNIILKEIRAKNHIMDTSNPKARPPGY